MLKKIIIYGFGTFASKLIAFILLPLYSYFLTQKELGEYDLIISVVTLLVPLIGLHIGESVYRELSEKKNLSENIISANVINSFVFMVLFQFISIGLFFIFENIINYKVSLVLLVLIILNSWFVYLQQIARGLDKTKIYSLMGAINSILLLAFSCVFLLNSENKLLGVLYAYILSYLLIVIWGFVILGLTKNLRLKYLSIKLIKEQVKYSFPLVGNLVSWWLINLSGKFIILSELGIEQNGLFAVSSRMSALIVVFNSVILMAIQDKVLCTKRKEKSIVASEEENNLYETFIKYEFNLLILLTILSPILISMLFDDKYFEAWIYMPILFYSAVISSFTAFIGLSYQIKRKTKGVFITTLIGGVVNVFVCFVLIDKIGLYGVSISSVLSFVTVLILRNYHTKYLYKFKSFTCSIIQYTLIFLLVYVALFLLQRNYYLILLLLIVYILFTCLNDKDLIKQMLNGIRNVKKNT